MIHSKRKSGGMLSLALLIVTIALLAGPAPGTAAPGANAASAKIVTDVISSGGREGTSKSFRIHDTFGQGPIGPLAVGISVTLQDGFWATISAHVDTNATPEDTIPPGFVQYFTATPGERADTLRWQNPTDADLAEVWIRYSTTGWANSPEEGSPVENGNGGKFTGMVPGAVNVFVHTGLTNGATYNYSLFTFDEAGNYPGYTSASATPFDNTPPTIKISIFQNPYVTNHLDVYLMASEGVIADSVKVTVGGSSVVMEESNALEYVFRGDYDLCCEGVVPVHGCACDLALNCACEDRSFSSSMVLAASGGSAFSADGALMLNFPGGAVTNDTYVLVLGKTESATGQPIYETSPGALELGRAIEVLLTYPDTTSKPEHWALARLEGQELVPIDSYLDEVSGRIVGFTDRLGAFGLVRREDVVTPTYGDGKFSVAGNVPNPFVESTSIEFDVSRPGEVRITIVSIDGRLVRTMTADFDTPGRHAVLWDGRDENGRQVAGGLYVCKAEFGQERVNHKIVHLR